MDFRRARYFGEPHHWFEQGTPWLGMLACLALVAGLVVVGVWFVGRTRRVGIDDPLRHAAARYADGKISRVEFDRIQTDLTAGGIGSSATPAPTAPEANDAAPPSGGPGSQRSPARPLNAPARPDRR